VKVIHLIESLKTRGVKVISITEPAFNMENEMGEVMLYLMGWFNNYFLRKLKREIKSGMDKARAQGKIIGRPGAVHVVPFQKGGASGPLSLYK